MSLPPAARGGRWRRDGWRVGRSLISSHVKHFADASVHTPLRATPRLGIPGTRDPESSANLRARPECVVLVGAEPGNAAARTRGAREPAGSRRRCGAQAGTARTLGVIYI